MRALAERHPLAFCLLLLLALLSLARLSEILLPSTVISRAGNLPLDLKSPPSGREQALLAATTPENLFWGLTILLATALLLGFGWWRGAGFTRPSQWRNLRLLVFPLLVGSLALSGGLRDLGPGLLLPALLGALISAFGEEAVFRGIMWRALAPKGLATAVLATSLFSGALYFGKATLAEGPWPEALLLTIPETCADFLYAVLRWRTASVWPVILLHFALGFLGEVSTPGIIPYLLQILFLASTLGFVGYALFLLRDQTS